MHSCSMFTEKDIIQLLVQREIHWSWLIICEEQVENALIFGECDVHPPSWLCAVVTPLERWESNTNGTPQECSLSIYFTLTGTYCPVILFANTECTMTLNWELQKTKHFLYFLWVFLWVSFLSLNCVSLEKAAVETVGAQSGTVSSERSGILQRGRWKQCGCAGSGYPVVWQGAAEVQSTLAVCLQAGGWVDSLDLPVPITPWVQPGKHYDQ